jgi:ABC-type sulfate/molybdate transport systems ATPase subunit
MQAELLALWEQRRFTAFLVTHDVEEALYLAGRILVLSHRPVRIQTEIMIDMPYPRHRGGARFAECASGCWANWDFKNTGRSFARELKPGGRATPRRGISSCKRTRIEGRRRIGRD